MLVGRQSCHQLLRIWSRSTVDCVSFGLRSEDVAAPFLGKEQEAKLI